MTKRIAIISVHECPLASSEGKERGGINVYTFELSKALSRLGWQVDAFTRIQDEINPRIVHVNDRFRVVHLPNGPHIPLSKKEIVRFLPEFTSAFTEYAHQYDLIHAHYYLSGLVATHFNLPTVMTFHTLGLMKQLISRSKNAENPEERISTERALCKRADRIITASESGKKYLARLYDCPNKKIISITPGVDTSIFRPIERQYAKKHIGAHPNHRIILAVGRIDPVKGFDILLYALKMLAGKHVCLWIVGGDVDEKRRTWNAEQTKLEALRKILGLETAVKFISAQPQEKLPAYYNAADVLVMPSHYESFGMVALEAIACGTPVIATDVTGISPLLKDTAGGHIISANNPIALAHALAHVLEQPHKRQKSIDMSLFTWDAVAKKIDAVYNDLLAAGS